MKIIPTETAHQGKIEKLLDQCFGNDRLSRTSYAVRLGTDALLNLSYVKIDNDEVIASIACWPICLKSNDNIIPFIMVGPIAVSPNHQNQGHGRQLVNMVIAQSKANYQSDLLMIGDPEYYGQFGFLALNDCDWKLPGPYEKHRLLVRRLLLPSEDSANLPKTGLLGPMISEAK